MGRGPAGRRPAQCHPEFIWKAFGLCNRCYCKRRREKHCCHCSKEKVPGRSMCEEHLAYCRQRSRLQRYGISAEEYEALQTMQDSKCAICGSAFHVLGSLGVDHDHRTGKVRGLLCHQCNLAVGNLKDDPMLCRRAAEYLERFLMG